MTHLGKPDSHNSDEALMQMLAEGNKAAFDELYSRYAHRMLLYFFRMLGGDTDQAQDFLQDLFMKVIEKCHLFQAERRFSTWIFTIAHNMCKNEYRRRKLRNMIRHHSAPGAQDHIGTDAQPSPESSIDRQHLLGLISREMDSWKMVQRSTFLLRFQAELSIREISEIMDCSEGTTKSRLFYITRKLAKKFAHYNPHHPQTNEDRKNGPK